MNTLQIETINACNARCVFCAVPNQKTKRKPMSMELFKSIIDKAKEYNNERGTLRNILPFLNGEPLLDRHLVERLEYINKTLPDCNIAFYSNGNLLTKEKAKALEGIKNLGINFSINHVSDEGRQALMGLPLQEAIDNILYFKEHNINSSIGVSALMDTTCMTNEQMQEFTKTWKENYRINPNLFFNGNWAGKTRTAYNITGSCGRPDTIMTVLSDGRVVLCCYDLEGEVVFGDLTKQSIKEIWESDEMEKYRFYNDAGRRKELKLCSSCTTG